MQKITLEEILFLHYMAIEDFGGVHGVRDEGRLKSIIESPFQHVFGKDLYPATYDKAAHIMRAIATEHPFIDGNKRTSVLAVGIFLERNGTPLAASQVDLEEFAIKVATDKLSAKQISAWLKNKTVGE